MEDIKGSVPDIPLQELNSAEYFGQSADEMVKKVDQVNDCWGKL